MQDKERDTLDLEEIMKEFCQEAPGQGEENLEELPPDFREFLHLDEKETEQDSFAELSSQNDSGELAEDDVKIFGAEPSLGDTVRLVVPLENSGTTQEVTGDTIRLDTIGIPSESGSNPKDGETPDKTTQTQVVEGDFTISWEPEYGQPMGEYVAPQPIVFRPRSRLRELKRKLVAGPEKRYYELAEKGVGKLQAAIFLEMLVAMLCIGATVMHTCGMVEPNRLRLMVFIQFFGLLLSALLGSFQMIEGVADVFHKRLTPNTLLAVTFLLCCVDGVFCLQQQRIPCCGAFSLQVIMSLWGTYHRRTTEMGQMDTLRKAVRLDSLAAYPDYFEGKCGLVRGEGQVEDFMDSYQAPSVPEKVLSWYCLAALLMSGAIAVTAGVFYGQSAGFQAGAISLLAAAPATIFITLSRPYAILEKRLHNLGAVLCGWRGVRGLKGKRVFPLTSEDIYPTGSARLNGVKFFGDRDTDDVVAYCAAMVGASDSGLTPVFNQLLDSRNGIHYTVDSLQYDDGGIVGTIAEEYVLVGSLAFMRRMGIEVSEGAKVPNAVCIAIEGQLCGLFAISYEKVRDSVAGLSTLSSYRGLQTVVTGRDFVLTENFIRSRFGIKTKRMAFPEAEIREQLQQQKAEEGAPALLLVTNYGLAPYAYGVTGARVLRRANGVGVAVHMIGGLLGMGMMLALVLLGAMNLLTPANMLAYQLVWMIPGLLITEWTRSI